MITSPRPRAFSAISVLRASATLAALAVLTVLGACASPAAPTTPGVAPALAPALGKTALTLTAQQSGATIELAVGQELVLRLATGATSGEEWALVDRAAAPGLFSVMGPSFERDARNAAAEEAGGHSVWRLRATRAGTVVLNFEYRRAHDLTPATQRATYSVTVR